MDLSAYASASVSLQMRVECEYEKLLTKHGSEKRIKVFTPSTRNRHIKKHIEIAKSYSTSANTNIIDHSLSL